MRFFKIIILLISNLFIVNCLAASAVFHDNQGHAIPVAELKGKWVIINYWADWCESCMNEIPELNRFYQHNQNKNVVLYGVNYDHMLADELHSSVSKSHIVYPVLLENVAEFWQLPSIEAVPATFIIDPNGKLAKTLIGENTEKSLLATINALQKISVS